MAEYVCKVGDPSGRILQHVETAQSEGEVRQKLAERGFYVFAVRPNLDLSASSPNAAPTAPSAPERFPDLQSAVQYLGESRSYPF